MGSTMSSALRLFTRWFGAREVRILLLGLDAAGKTTILYQLKLGEIVTTIPTIGFNVETVEAKGLHMVVWDVGGRNKIRPLYRHYYQNTDGIIFAVDANDHDRVEDAREQLAELLAEDQLRNIPLLVLANKQDLPTATDPDALADALGLGKITGRPVHIQGCCAFNKGGLLQGLEWLSAAISTSVLVKAGKSLYPASSATPA
eukprot:m.227050 g.227050  ORF g.227050 m.227050 type:complete len:202 (-) comp11522_c0_seq1:77-682(-)